MILGYKAKNKYISYTRLRRVLLETAHQKKKTVFKKKTKPPYAKTVLVALFISKQRLWVYLNNRIVSISQSPTVIDLQKKQPQ